MSDLGARFQKINIPLIDESKYKSPEEFKAKLQGLPNKIMDAFVNLYDELFV
jgi:hypothetical protein